jgi:hypothetical protein
MMWPQTDTQSKPASLRQRSMNLMSLAPGSVLHFSATTPLAPFTNGKANVDAVRTYLFGSDMTISYPLSVGGRNGFQLTIA